MTDSTKSTKKDTDSAAVRKAYSLAEKDLREAHREEFQSLVKSHAAELGVDWTPRKTAAEKAADQMALLLAEHPGLREQLAKDLGVTEAGPTAAFGGSMGPVDGLVSTNDSPMPSTQG